MPRRQRGVTAAQQSTGDPAPVGGGHVERVRVQWGSGSSIRKRSSWKATRHKLSASGVCEVCGWEPPEKRLLHAHHVVPRCHGGGDEPENLLVVCPNHHALAHYVSKRTYRVYAGPRTRAALLEKIRLVEFEQELLRRGRSA
jgi:hypothetical protein